MKTLITASAALAISAGSALAFGPADTDSFFDAARTFNDFSGSTLTYASDYSAGTVSIVEDNYGAGGFANRHSSWFADGGTRVDVNYGDSYTIATTMTVNATGVDGQVEAGIHSDLFGFGFFGALTGNGEIAAFGGTNQFHTFGTGLYNLGDTVMLEMSYAPGAGELLAPASTVEYRYNNMTTGSGWVSSGALTITNLEGGIPSGFDQFYGVGAQINQPSANASVNIQFTDTSFVPTPASAALLGLGGLVATRRRR